MSPDPRIGDLLIVGFDGLAAPDHALERLRTGRAGGIILFARNVHDGGQLTELCATLQAARREAADTPLIIAIDQEGGSVARLRDPWPQLPGNMALGATDDPALAEEAGAWLAQLLLPLGITLNLAPVLDLASTPDNPGIGVRSFGADAERVGTLGAELIRGMQAHGLDASAKHFPGMGDARQDAHDVMPIVQTDLPTLQQHHMAPFVAAMEAGVACWMMSHCAYPALDRMTRLPVTVNRRLIQQTVRRELGYDGAVITDCVEMKALTERLASTTGATNAVMAGADLVLVCHTPSVQDAVFDALQTAAERGLIAEQVLSDAARRGARLRHARAVSSTPDTDPAELGRAIAGRALTWVRGEGVPALAGKRVVLLVPEAFEQTAAEDGTVGHLEPLAATLRDGGCTVGVSTLHAEVALPPVDGVVVVTANAHLHAEQAVAARAILARAEAAALVLAVRNPFDADLFPEHPVLLTYSDTPPAQEAAAAVLLGLAGAPGTPPVPLQSRA